MSVVSSVQSQSPSLAVLAARSRTVNRAILSGIRDSAASRLGLFASLVWSDNSGGRVQRVSSLANRQIRATIYFNSTWPRTLSIKMSVARLGLPSKVYQSLIRLAEPMVPAKLQPLWNHPAGKHFIQNQSDLRILSRYCSFAGPKTVFFWAPAFKWVRPIISLSYINSSFQLIINHVRYPLEFYDYPSIRQFSCMQTADVIAIIYKSICTY